MASRLCPDIAANPTRFGRCEFLFVDTWCSCPWNLCTAPDPSKVPGCPYWQGSRPQAPAPVIAISERPVEPPPSPDFADAA